MTCDKLISRLLEEPALPEPLLTSVRAVLFDLDGTLLDSLEDIARSANLVLASQGFPGHPADAYRRFIGEGVGTLFQRAFPEDVDVDDRTLVARCVDGFREAYGRGWNVATQLYDGIPELLDALDASALSLAILSNKPDVFTRQCVDEYLKRWRFVVVFGDREGIPRKPDPAGALEIAARLGVEPGAIAYVGDSSVDMTTARRAGMIAIGVAWGFRPVDELWSSGADHVIAHPLELLDLLTLKQRQVAR